MKIRALTISQPWASLIACGEKWIENRGWAVHSSYYGPIAIHAGKGLQYLTRKEIVNYQTSAIIATARLATCIPLQEIQHTAARWPDVKVDCVVSGKVSAERVASLPLTYGQLAAHRFAEGPFCWVLQDIQAIEPIPYRGAQGFWYADIEPVPCDPSRYVME